MTNYLPLVLFITAYSCVHCIALWSSHAVEDEHNINADRIEEIISEVNGKADSMWIAGHNFDGNYEELNIEQLLGSEKMQPAEQNELDIVDEVICQPQGGVGIRNVDIGGHKDHVKEFDTRTAWPNCSSIVKVRNQGNCASDWVIAPTSVITDRWCIATNAKEKVEMSAHEPLSCCKSCGSGCKRGYSQTVYHRFVTKGLASGGDYNSTDTCQPYEIEPCQNYTECLKGKNAKTPTCKPYCYNKNYGGDYHKDIKKGYKAFKLQCPLCGGDEMAERGPISATMVIYEDFLTYKSGIYHHVHGKRLGKLTVKLIGFNDNHDPKYWIAVNSWGTKWGDNGLFKIVRLQSECLIDDALYAVWVDKVNEQ